MKRNKTRPQWTIRHGNNSNANLIPCFVVCAAQSEPCIVFPTLPHDAAGAFCVAWDAVSGHGACSMDWAIAALFETELSMVQTNRIVALYAHLHSSVSDAAYLQFFGAPPSYIKQWNQQRVDAAQQHSNTTTTTNTQGVRNA